MAIMMKSIRNLPESRSGDTGVVVLAVSPHEADHACLRAIFSHSNWSIFGAHGWHEALPLLDRNRITVLLCERDLPDGNWKNLLDALAALPLPPMLIVTSSDVNASLWADALNAGAYDVLSKPFDRTEVTRIISLAWLHWKEEATRISRESADRTSAAQSVAALSAVV
jgi:DNA-binding NtrC family response regulator